MNLLTPLWCRVEPLHLIFRFQPSSIRHWRSSSHYYPGQNLLLEVPSSFWSSLLQRWVAVGRLKTVLDDYELCSCLLAVPDASWQAPQLSPWRCNLKRWRGYRQSQVDCIHCSKITHQRIFCGVTRNHPPNIMSRLLEEDAAKKFAQRATWRKMNSAQSYLYILLLYI